MGYCIEMFLVRTDVARLVVGSGNSTWIDRVLKSHADHFAQLDEEQLEYADEEDDPPLTHEAALRELIAGKFSQRSGNQYAHAFQAICELDGEYLPNHGLSAMPRPTQYLKQLDEAMTKLEVPLSFSNLVFMQPAKFPFSDDISIGHWTNEQITGAAAALERCLEEIDPDMKASVENALEIAALALAQPDRMVVGFM